MKRADLWIDNKERLGWRIDFSHDAYKLLPVEDKQIEVRHYGAWRVIGNAENAQAIITAHRKHLAKISSYFDPKRFHYRIEGNEVLFYSWRQLVGKVRTIKEAEVIIDRMQSMLASIC